LNSKRGPLSWVSPAILEEYADVLGDHPEFVAGIVESFPRLYPLTELSVIRHERDNRFLECALAASADLLFPSPWTAVGDPHQMVEKWCGDDGSIKPISV